MAEVSMMDTKKNSKLQNARLAAGMSQSQLASAAGLNVRTLQCYEQGVKDLNGAKLATLLKLCLALDCKLGDILTDEVTVKLLEQYTAA
jgi:transcriptional regulator with XRE-family HTH domain